MEEPFWYKCTWYRRFLADKALFNSDETIVVGTLIDRYPNGTHEAFLRELAAECWRHAKWDYNIGEAGGQTCPKD